MTGPPLLVRVKTAAKRNRRGKRKQQKEATKTPLPPRVQRKGLRRVPGNSQKRVGPRMAPQGKHQEAGRTAKKGEQANAAGQKRTRKNKTSPCGGVPCYYLSCLSQKKRRRRRRNNQRKKEDNPKTPDLTSREIFKTVSGAKKQMIKQKHRQNSTKTRKTHTDTQNQKLAPEVFFKQRP